MPDARFATLKRILITALDLPADEREPLARWFYEEQFPQLMDWDERYTENRVRNHTTFPMSFSITADKPT